MVIAAPILVENPDATPEAEGIVNLVVLPFSSRDFSDENQILADGIREALTHGLSKLNQIQVMSPPRQPELMNASLQTDSNYLRQADHILQGSVRQPMTTYALSCNWFVLMMAFENTPISLTCQWTTSSPFRIKL